jgi:hypothetical protein
MKIRFEALLLACVVLTVSAPAHPQDAPSGTQAEITLTNNDVVAMISSGLSVEVVNAKIVSSRCNFDTSPKGLADLKAANVPDAVVVMMLGVPKPIPIVVPKETTERQEKVAQEKQKGLAGCPGCPAVLISNFDSASRTTTDDWVSKNQLAYVKERVEKARKDKAPHLFWFTSYRENADFIVVWSSAVGSRPYTTYVPQTTNSTTQVNGDVNLTAQTSSTTYHAEYGEREYVNVVASVYGRDGKKLFATTHQGNWRWSKPDKDCLEDSLNYVHEKLVHP